MPAVLFIRVRSVIVQVWFVPGSEAAPIGRLARVLASAVQERVGSWVARDDGHGFEIKGISGEMMRLFSSRRESITAELRVRAARFEQRYALRWPHFRRHDHRAASRDIRRHKVSNYNHDR